MCIPVYISRSTFNFLHSFIAWIAAVYPQDQDSIYWLCLTDVDVVAWMDGYDRG